MIQLTSILLLSDALKSMQEAQVSLCAIRAYVLMLIEFVLRGSTVIQITQFSSSMYTILKQCLV